MIKIVEIKGGLQGLWGEKNRLSLSEPPIRSIDPETGNTVVTQDSHSATFSRDMTEEQIIAHFDSLN